MPTSTTRSTFGKCFANLHRELHITDTVKSGMFTKHLCKGAASAEYLFLSPAYLHSCAGASRGQESFSSLINKETESQPWVGLTSLQLGFCHMALAWVLEVDLTASLWGDHLTWDLRHSLHVDCIWQVVELGMEIKQAQTTPVNLSFLQNLTQVATRPLPSITHLVLFPSLVLSSDLLQKAVNTRCIQGQPCTLYPPWVQPQETTRQPGMCERFGISRGLRLEPQCSYFLNCVAVGR